MLKILIFLYLSSNFCRCKNLDSANTSHYFWRLEGYADKSRWMTTVAGMGRPNTPITRYTGDTLATGPLG
jgi:hypothetical protein